MVSLETRAMFTEQLTVGQIYRNELAHGLRQLGYALDHEPRSGLFEIKGVPRSLMRDFSQRTEEIEAHAREHGLVGQAAQRASFYATRPAKAKADLGSLNEQWIVRARGHSAALSELREGADLSEACPLIAPAPIAARAALFGLRQAETGEAVNNLGTILRHALAAYVGEVRLVDVRPRLEVHEDRRKLLVTHEQTGDDILTRGRTSRATARREQAFARHIVLGLDDARAIASADRLLPVLERAGLNPEQEQALVAVATSRDRLTAIHGVAGAGKSTLVRVLKDAAEPGTVMIAMALTSSAAAELGDKADLAARTVASLLATGGRGLTEHHVLVLDEAGQLGNRQALRILEISRKTGSRVLFLGDNRQTGAIEQGKAFWLLQRLGLPTAQLTESIRQETRSMKEAVEAARSGDYAASLALLDRVSSGDTANGLAKGLVAEWTRLSPASRAGTSILVLDNATRLIVNAAVRETLKREGVVAAEDHRLSVLTPTGLTDVQKQLARFYSGGQVVMFGRDEPRFGLARDTEYRVVGLARDSSGRKIVQFADERGRTVQWDPRLSRPSLVNVFNREERDLSTGDRIQWRLANKTLDLKNAERGTIDHMDGSLATVCWDRGDRVKQVDLAAHKTWDHGYAETVYSAQSKTYPRVYVLAPLGSPLVNGQNYYTAITRARLGVKLWTEDSEKLARALTVRSGAKSSSLEGMGRLDRDSAKTYGERHGDRLRLSRQEQERERADRKDQATQGRGPCERPWADRVAGRALAITQWLERYLQSVTERRVVDEIKASPSNSHEQRETKRSGAQALGGQDR